MEKFDVVVCGKVFVDIIFSPITKLPNPGEEVFCDDFEFTCGGAYNTAVALSRLGMKTAIVSVIGNDFLSNFIKQKLEQEGVSTEFLVQLDQPLRSLSVAINFDNDRSFISFQDQLTDFHFEKHLETFMQNINTKAIHVSATPEILNVVQLAKQREIFISLDVGWDENWLKDPRLLELIQYADLFTPNLKEALYITGKQTPEAALAALNALNDKNTVIVKLGGNGAMYKKEEKYITVPTVKKSPIDTTGAGDVFAAGLLTGILKDYDLYDAIRLGNYCGSCSVEGLGGTKKAPYWKDVKEELFNS